MNRPSIIYIIIGIAFTILVLIAGMSVSRAFAQTNNQTFVTYGKSVFGLSVKHPQDWEVKESDREIRDGRTGYEQFATLCPKAILEYPLKEKGIPDYTQCPIEKEVVISVYHLPPNITLSEYANLRSSPLKLSFMNFEMLESNRTTLSGLPAIKIIYKFLGEKEIIKMEEIMTIKDNKAYHFTYTSPILEFDDLLPTVQKMIDSLNILAMPPCKFVEDKESAYGGKCVL